MNVTFRHQAWEQMPLEPLKPLLDRRVISGERMMIAQILLKKDCLVPKHSHDNEQITYVISGALRSLLGEEQVEPQVGGTGAVGGRIVTGF